VDDTVESMVSRLNGASVVSGVLIIQNYV
jgi:hypothetical protein